MAASTQAAALDALGCLDPASMSSTDGLVERGLLGGEVAPDLHLDLVRQVGDDRLVGLQPAQHERPGGPLAARRSPSCVAVPLDRDREAAAGTVSAGPSRPGLENSMIDHSSARRFSTGVPVSASRVRGRERRGPPAPAGCARFLMFCASSQTTRPQRDLAPARPGRAAASAVGGDDQVGLGHAPRRARRRASRSAPWCTCTRSSGANRAASRCQLPTSDIGHTSSVGPAGPAARSVSEQRQQLGRLAQAHVVGEDAAEPEPRQEGQPGQPALLVRAQLAVEAGGRGHRREPRGRPGRTAGRRASRRRPPRPAAGPRRRRRTTSLQHLAGRQLARPAAARGTSAPP